MNLSGEHRNSTLPIISSLDRTVDNRERKVGVVEDGSAQLPVVGQQMWAAEIWQRIDVGSGDVMSHIIVCVAIVLTDVRRIDRGGNTIAGSEAQNSTVRYLIQRVAVRVS